MFEKMTKPELEQLPESQPHNLESQNVRDLQNTLSNEFGTPSAAQRISREKARHAAQKARAAAERGELGEISYTPLFSIGEKIFINSIDGECVIQESYLNGNGEITYTLQSQDNNKNQNRITKTEAELQDVIAP